MRGGGEAPKKSIKKLKMKKIKSFKYIKFLLELLQIRIPDWMIIFGKVEAQKR